MTKNLQKQLKKIPDFDVLAQDPETVAEIIKERLKDIKIDNVKIIKHEAIGDIIPSAYEIIVDKDTVAFIYKTIACHSYNEISYKKTHIRIATIDTMMSFYLAFLYTNRPYYDIDRILCMAKFLFEVQQKNRLEQKGLLKRFSIHCYGHQDTVEEMRAEKSQKFSELKNNRNNPEFEEWFLMYKPETKLQLSKYNADNTERKDDKTHNIKHVVMKNKKTMKNSQSRSHPSSYPYKSSYFKVIKSKKGRKTKKKSNKRRFLFF